MAWRGVACRSAAMRPCARQRCAATTLPSPLLQRAELASMEIEDCQFVEGTHKKQPFFGAVLKLKATCPVFEDNYEAHNILNDHDMQEKLYQDAGWPQQLTRKQKTQLRLVEDNIKANILGVKDYPAFMNTLFETLSPEEAYNILVAAYAELKDEVVWAKDKKTKKPYVLVDDAFYGYTGIIWLLESMEFVSAALGKGGRRVGVAKQCNAECICILRVPDRSRRASATFLQVMSLREDLRRCAIMLLYPVLVIQPDENFAKAAESMCCPNWMRETVLATVYFEYYREDKTRKNPSKEFPKATDLKPDAFTAVYNHAALLSAIACRADKYPVYNDEGTIVSEACSAALQPCHAMLSAVPCHAFSCAMPCFQLCHAMLSAAAVLPALSRAMLCSQLNVCYALLCAFACRPSGSPPLLLEAQ